jgi:hypothetical protein
MRPVSQNLLMRSIVERIVSRSFGLSIGRPARLDGALQIQPIVSGAAVGNSGAVTALRIERYEFRTRRAGSRVEPRQELAG